MKFCEILNIPKPPERRRIYSFFPLYSPFQLQDDHEGFDLGEDNRIHSLSIHSGTLWFTISTLLRPGRFLGSHYVAFSVPIRTFTLTLDRVRAWLRAAWRAKKAALNSTEESYSKIRTFISRFLDEYLLVEKRESEERERLAATVQDFFGSQTSSSMTPRTAEVRETL